MFLFLERKTISFFILNTCRTRVSVIRAENCDSDLRSDWLMRRYRIDRRGRSRQVRVNWIMFRLRRFARHPCISYWQRIITASGQFAALCKSLPLHFRENLYRKYACGRGKRGPPAVSVSLFLPLIFLWPFTDGNLSNRCTIGRHSKFAIVKTMLDRKTAMVAWLLEK